MMMIYKNEAIFGEKISENLKCEKVSLERDYGSNIQAPDLQRILQIGADGGVLGILGKDIPQCELND